MEDFITDITPQNWETKDSIIKVVGVGGGGCNAVSYMYDQHIEGCDFVVCNTDSQALQKSNVPVKIQMGRGLGAGTDPTKGRNAAIEAQEEIARIIFGEKTKMLFLTAGMGGGTGTGAAPVIAKMAHDKGILTVAVVTLPFSNEGNEALSRAIDGIHELERNVDSLLIINNEKLYDYFGDLLIYDAFPKADEVLATAVKGIIEIINKPGYINVDFEDVKTMMKNSGMALMGCGAGTGKNRIEDAIKQAFESPLLNDFDLKTAKNVLINITTGRNEKGLKMADLGEVNAKISEYTGGANNFKRGLIFDEDPDAGDRIQITAIATGFAFNNLIGPDINLGKLIFIDKDFVYNKEALASGDGLSLPEDSNSHIVYSSGSCSPAFRFDPDKKPVLLVGDGQDISDLETTPAIDRARQNTEI